MVETAMGGAGTAVFARDPGVIEVHELEPQHAAVVRIEVPMAGIPDAMGAAFGDVAAALGRAGVAMNGVPFARYLSFDADGVVAEVGVPVPEPVGTSGRVYPAVLPGGPVASAVHVGPYDTLHETYARVEAWMADARRTPAGDMWEVYWSEPVGDPATWRTEICWPVSAA